MKENINISTNHGQHSTNIEIDNTTEFKDFQVVNLKGEERLSSIGVTLGVNEGEQQLVIGKTILIGFELSLFREFILQNVK